MDGFKKLNTVILALLMLIGLSACQEAETRKKRDKSRTLQLNTPGVEESEGMAKFRGYELMNKIINDRIIDEDHSLDIGDYLKSKEESEEEEQDPFAALGGGLTALLGQHEGSGIERGFRNGEPNAVNMQLWYIVMAALSQDINEHCQSEATDHALKLNDDFKVLLEPLCQWPEEKSEQDVFLTDLWKGLLFFDAPDEEIVAWLDFVNSQEFQEFDQHKKLESALIAMTMNPYFLLKH